MNHFELLGSLALQLHNEFKTLYFLMLPVCFSLSLALTWFRFPQGGTDFLEALRRIFVGTILLIAFPEITDAILAVSNGIADKISDMQGLDQFIEMARTKTRGYTFSAQSLIIAFDDFLIALISFLSFFVLYIARYIMVAVYHFSWVFMSLLSPVLLIFHVFSPKITLNLFRTMIEIASWKVVWAVLSAILLTLPFGNAYAVEGDYLTVVVINFVIAICMLGTPLVVRSLVGSGFSAMASTVVPAVAGAMVAAPAKVAAVATTSRNVLGATAGSVQGGFARTSQKYSSMRDGIQSVFQSSDTKAKRHFQKMSQAPFVDRSNENKSYDNQNRRKSNPKQ